MDPRLCAFHMCKRICAFLYVLVDMCEAFVRLNMCTVEFTTSYLLLPLFRHLFPSMPPRAPQGASRRPPGSPLVPQEKAHIKHFLFGPPRGAPRGRPRSPREPAAHNAAHILHIRKQGPGARSQEPAAHNGKQTNK